MTYIAIFLAFLAVHWFADFVCQTDWQAKNKSKNMDALIRHVLIYTAVFGVGTVAILGVDSIRTFLYFVLLNGILHLVTDFITSRITSHLYAKGHNHYFFVAIGFDQLIHQVTIAMTLVAMFGDTL